MSNLDQHAGGAIAFLVSLVGHTLLLLLLACWVFMPGAPQDGLSIRLEIGQEEMASLELLTTSEDSQQIESPMEADKELESQLSKVQLSVEDLQLLPDDWSGSEAVGSAEASLASFEILSSSQALDAEGPRQGASFFGAYAPGGRFVYVMDTSKSMEGRRWTLAKQQLLESLRELGPNRQFFVICFDMRTSLMFDYSPDQMEFFPADAATLKRVERWLRSRKPGPATLPATALQLALQLQPDAIFFLSDGELHDDSLYRLRLLNVDDTSRDKIPIHAVHLMSLEGKQTLQQIAEENAGTFTYIGEKPKRRR
jgi:uncharacterized protein with von Willebrand factor type A (vWA) domain